MLSEEAIHILVITHAVTGSLGLMTGLVAIIVKKGGITHKRFGRFFYYSMLSTACLALFVSVLPNHESPFLFVIGIFSSYFILTGYRAVRFKNKNPELFDYIISWVMIITGLCMIAIPMILSKEMNIVLSVFGFAGLIFSIQDVFIYRRPEDLKLNWLKVHLGKMMGAYISAVTAFVVVNQILPGVYGWIAPGVIGGVFIALWSRKISSQA